MNGFERYFLWKSCLTDPWMYKWDAIILKCVPLFNMRNILLSIVYLDLSTSVTTVEVICYSIRSQMALFDGWKWVSYSERSPDSSNKSQQC